MVSGCLQEIPESENLRLKRRGLPYSILRRMHGRRSGALAVDRFDSGAVRATFDVRLKLPMFVKRTLVRMVVLEWMKGGQNG